MSQETVGGGSTGKSIRQQRSPAYPSEGLPVALEAIKKLYARAQRVSVDPETAVRAFGYSGLHGPARSRIAALKKYGLLDEDKDGSLKLSGLALQYVLPNSDAERQQAIDHAGLLPPLFQDLFLKKDASDDVLKSLLVRNRGFSDAGATQAIKAFRETMTLVKASPEGYNSPDTEGQEGSMMLDQTAIQTPSTQRVVVRSGAPPVNIALDANKWLSIQGPFPLSETEWQQMLTVLSAMKPGLVATTPSAPASSGETVDLMTALKESVERSAKSA